MQAAWCLFVITFLSMIVQGKSLCMVPHLGVGLLIKYEMSLDLIKIFQLWLFRDGKDPVIL